MNRIQHYRTKRGLTQTDLGNLLKPKLRQSAVSNHEIGVRTPDVYQAIQYAKALDTAVEELFSPDEPQAAVG